MSSGENSIEAVANTQRPRNLIRSQYKDIMVKVDEDIYYLDRLQLALTSGYFEKLFTEDYRERNSDLIEIPLMDTNTFSSIVDIMYGHTLHSVVKSDNFVSVLMAMDYLQMDVYEETYRHLVTKRLRSESDFNKDVFRLYDFITQNTDYEYLLLAAFEHLSLYFGYLRDLDEFLSIPIHHFIEIISQRGIVFYEEQHIKQEFCQICAKWLCHDMENRLPRITDVVNAVRCRFNFSNEISPEDLRIKLLSDDKHMNEEKLSRYLYALIVYSGETGSGIDDDTLEVEDEDVYTSEKDQDHYAANCSANCSNYEDESKSISRNQFSFSEEPKLETFLKNGLFYDITLKIGEKVYKLHRSVLKSKSSYFEEIFSTEYTEISSQHEEKPPAPPCKDKVYFLPNDIDSIIFDRVIDYIYFEKKEFSSDVIVRLFKASYALKIDCLLESCDDWMMDNSKDMCSEDVFDMINFTHTLDDYEYLNQFFSPKYIIDSWPKVDHSSALFADFFDKVFLPVKTDCDGNEVRYLFDEIDKKTFEWIIHRIYNDEKVKLTDENVANILRASELLKMNALIMECVNWLTPSARQTGITSCKDVIEVLKFARRNIKYKALDPVYLARHMTEWPRIDDSLFYCISYECLENLLSSPYFLLDDPRDILDMCSKWVIHDTENRYRYVPGIAFAISRNCRMVCDNYSFEIPSDFSHCSQEFVKNELWKVLSSTSVLPLAVLRDNETSNRTIENPVFITSVEDGKFAIFNVDCDKMASFYICKNVSRKSSFHYVKYPMSACMINDNLYILCSMNRTTYFHVYNISSRKLFYLTSDSRNYAIKKISTFGTSPHQVFTDRLFHYTLLNCRNEIYCCLENGEIFKYSFEFNRWARFSEPELDKYEICYTSDGNKLYRMCNVENDDDTVDYTLQVYNFQDNSWVSMANSTLTCPRNKRGNGTNDKTQHELIFVHDYGLLALIKFKCQLFLYDNESQSWRNVGLPSTDHWRDMAIGQDQGGDEILYVVGDRLYHRSPSDRDFVLKMAVTQPATERRFRPNYSSLNNPFTSLRIIHNPKILT